MRRVHLFSAVAAFALMTASVVSPALAGGRDYHPASTISRVKPLPLVDGTGGFKAPTVSTALATALGVNGAYKGLKRSGGGPSVQVAVGAAVSIDGNATAGAFDSLRGR